ncbi:FtsX-like permease family protein [Rhodocytophaga rosea]|uniref:FtsX-like permease family protein n=1 Tax=Rhodocytophaga rosea TaxID=2704465 RepID=A0A6C0GCV2_9BACT|nr:ABC transporter permease [Rhodocytophaga rosea]QHT65809.1 FtsX-like permease family protein [Rhodocytophaga rosea]
MLKNYITIAFRNLLRQKGHTAINIAGLAIGIATCMLIMLFIQDELSYDKFNEKADRIYRINFIGKLNGEDLRFPLAPAPAAQMLKTDYPEVQEATRVRVSGSPLVTYENNTFKENSFAYVDSNFFQVFTIPFLKGNPKTALNEPNTVVISQELAKKYFGNQEPVGKVLQFKAWQQSYKVTGVIDKVPSYSHFHFDMFASMSSLEESKQPVFVSFNFHTYLVLPKGYDYKQLEAKLPQVVDKYMAPQLQQFMGINFEELKKKGDHAGLFLQPLTDIHLHSNFQHELEPGGDIQYVYIFGAIALFMLLIACINFMNLSTASAAKRAKEVGIRKVLGSVKQQLVGQFLVESILLVSFSLVLAVVLVFLAIPVFNNLADKQLSLLSFVNPFLILGLLLFGLLVGVIAGSYPAFFLSSFQPIEVLKGKMTVGGKTIGLRSALVVFQFFISTNLIVGTAVVYEQLTYIQHKKIGYDKDQLMVIHDTYALDKNEEVFKQQLLRDSRVASASISSYIPAGPTNWNNSVVQPENNNSQSVTTQQYQVDHDYVPTLGMEIVKGRNFSKDFPTDSTAVIINEAAMRAFGWSQDPLNKVIGRFIDNKGNKLNYRVVGVVKDFHFESLHRTISPLLMFLGDNGGSVIVRSKTKDVEGLLSTMKNQWSQFGSGSPFAYSFMDERFAETYEAEQKVGRIIGIFAGITIFVACLGLFGLATFTAQQRTKEIGIRKVLGASVFNITLLLSKEFSKLVLIGFLISVPVSWYAMHKWLENFAYKINVGIGVFVVAGLLALCIAWLTVSYQSIKAALTNPVKSLRSE